MTRAWQGMVAAAVLAAAVLGAGGRTFADYRDEERVDRYIAQLRFDRDDHRREDAAKKLGSLGSFRAVPALVQALLSDRDDDVREETAKALGRIGDLRALPALRQAAATDRDSDVRKEAYKAIDRLDPPRIEYVPQPVPVVVEWPVVRYVETPTIVYSTTYVRPSTSIRVITPPPPPVRHVPPPVRHLPPPAYERRSYVSVGSSGALRFSYQGQKWHIGVSTRW